MKRTFSICTLAISLTLVWSSGDAQVYKKLNFDFYGIPIQLECDTSLNTPFDESLSGESVQNFAFRLMSSEHTSLSASLEKYRNDHKLDDWLFYQLIRATAQQLSPKEANYNRYTLIKWHLLTITGYDARLKLANDQLLFYVQCSEAIYNIPYYEKNDRQYVCLNYHDFKEVDFRKYNFTEVPMPVYGEKNFSYKISSLPQFTPSDYDERTVHFDYYQKNYRFSFKLNPSIRKIFKNYPAVDYASYFNIPLSHQTYQSLIPVLKENTSGMDIKEGVDYLMRFTRYAFLFQTDTRIFGAEKRLTPEQTLLSEYSDCEDRSALFFYLVKEIYNLPMLVIAYPNHVTVAVKFDKPAGKPIVYNGSAYSICEPTPQKKDLRLGELPKSVRNQPYEIAYVYTPSN